METEIPPKLAPGSTESHSASAAVSAASSTGSVNGLSEDAGGPRALPGFEAGSPGTESIPVKTVEPSEAGGVTASETMALELPLLGAVAPEAGGLETPVRSLDGLPAEMRVESEPPATTATIGGGDTAGPVNVSFVTSAPDVGVAMWITGTSTTTALVDTATVAVVGATTVSVTTVVVTVVLAARAEWIVDDEDGAPIVCWLGPELTVVLEDEVLGAEGGAGWLLGGVEG